MLIKVNYMDEGKYEMSVRVILCSFCGWESYLWCFVTIFLVLIQYSIQEFRFFLAKISRSSNEDFYDP